MIKLRRILAAMLLVFVGFCSVAFNAEISNATVKTSYLSYNGIKAGTKVLWYPSSNPSGYSMTGGGTQKLKICMNTTGNKIQTGLYSVGTGSYNIFYGGTVTNYNTAELPKVISASGYYQPYLKNNNTSVSINVQNTSYIKYE